MFLPSLAYTYPHKSLTFAQITSSTSKHEKRERPFRTKW